MSLIDCSDEISEKSRTEIRYLQDKMYVAHRNKTIYRLSDDPHTFTPLYSHQAALQTTYKNDI